jgi:hypothetical protein
LGLYVWTKDKNVQRWKSLAGEAFRKREADPVILFRRRSRRNIANFQIFRLERNYELIKSSSYDAKAFSTEVCLISEAIGETQLTGVDLYRVEIVVVRWIICYSRGAGDHSKITQDISAQ